MSDIMLQSPNVVALAYQRICQLINKAPLISLDHLNDKLGAKCFLKLEAHQKTGAFKIRGVLNHILTLQESGMMPSKIVAYSTGNHAIAMAYAARLFGIEARIYLPANVSLFKQNLVREYGAELVIVPTRAEAEEKARLDKLSGYHYIPPSDDDNIIAGAGTLCYEALMQLAQMEEESPGAIFASCGGGGLLAGSYLAKELLAMNAQIFGAEPEVANDAYISLQQNSIFRFSSSPNTIADGLRTLSVSQRSFAYLQKLNAMLLVSEEQIHYWTKWLNQHLDVACEPSAAISVAAAHQWLKLNAHKGNILILLSGGNLEPSF
jgi:threonine dehydratase